MGRHFWTKHIGDEHDHKQPGCISGFINVLYYHHWHSNTRKMIHHNKYAGQTGDWSPKANLLAHDSCEAEKILDEKQSPFLKMKRARGNNKRSLKSRIKALIAEEIYKESNDAQGKEGFLFKSRLQRTYSIHHLESLDDSISKICTDWKNPIIFIPSKVENSAPRSVDMSHLTQTQNEASGGESNIFSAANIGSSEKIDFLDMLKIDKELFARNLQVSDERVTRFSHNGLASNEKLKFSKSRSFPDLNFSQRLKFKPSKLADKQKETWSFPKGQKLQAVSQEQKLALSEEKDRDSLMKGEIQQGNEWMAPSDIAKGVVDIREETTMGRVGENTTRNYSHSRSSSLNESLDKYARLFENSYGTEAKLNLSRSLRLTNENDHASMYLRRIRSRSLSNAYSFYSNLNLGVAGDDAFRNDSFVIEKDDSFRQDVVEHEENVVRLVSSDSEKEPLDLIETVECKTESVDDMQKMDHDSGLNLNAIDESGEKKEDFEEEARKPTSVDFICVQESINDSDPCSIPDSYTISQEKLSGSEQLKISEDKFVESVGHATDSGYVRLILDQSGIAKDASERAWHASDQPLSPQILEDVEACWPHEHDHLTSWQDFCSSCWQHQMLFDLVNETLVETYDVSLPYYPKPLSSSCHVRPFPAGNHIVEEVSKSIGKLLNLRTDEKQSLDCLMVCDLKDDCRWMNLQFESECIGLELEDMILDDLVEELVCF
ncbi:uncharacterized protein [Primulina huaijiensis]|uniref:uncharacterized protein n=1 Tax=Primulina huaijiensis TaxID=1492673 RepID=UPI003CC70BFE